ncbi:LRR and NB-ARC domains-containing disease resistance protein [Rhynchospora pubera]|uniref:LRR and NB-ARC domains-containing disease resistance protein n=1 Tax=Rhynchospora pubera TaxID=906938 RepID=A0AAV8FAU4_9POAL|nr:LRR and NB-ARC domains-containing disease resistance protein [Rhynchospora pubera]
MNSVGQVVAAAIPSIIDPVLKNIAYPFKVSDNVKALEKATATLTAAQTDVNENAARQGLMLSSLVENWSLHVEEVKVEAGDIKRRYEERSRCFGSQSFNCWSNFWISKDAARKLMEIKELRDEGANFTEVAIQLLPQVPELPIGSEVVVPKEESNREEILRYINSDQNGIFGIWGMGGVGKTRLLHLVHNHYKKENSANLFVVKVTASKGCTVEKLQKELCENCGLDIDRANSSAESQARIISHYLTTKRNFLILLDDLWGQIDLEKVGIPLGLGKQFKKKVVITTRFESVCNLMGVEESVRVAGLETEDALRLFYEKVGEKTVKSHPGIPSLAREIVKELGGLPLALIIIGASMRGKKHPRNWVDRIASLKESRLKGIDEEENLFHRLKLSYDSLNEKSKHCFLVCSLWPEDYFINKIELIECWLGLGLLDLSHTRNIYNPGYDVIRKLLSACLLEEVGSEYVKMHDVIRDMALWIARGEDKENDKWVVLDGLDQMRHKNIRWSDVERASLISYELMVPMNGKELPLNPYEYDELISDGSDEWEGVPLIPCDATRLQFVRVHLRYPFTPTIDAVVQNVSIFGDLAFLELRNCDLYSFPQGISQLVKLEHLNLENNQITSVPDELKHVRNLRFLSLGHNSISLFPKGVLPELKELMVLDLYNIYYCGSGGEQHWTWLINELSCLSKLRCLSIKLQQPAHFRNLLELSNLPVRTLFLHYKNETDTLEIPSSFIGKVQDNLYKLELKVRSVRKLLFGSNYQSRLGNLEFLSFLMDELEMIEWPWNVPPEDLLPMLHDLFFECWRILDVSWTLYLPCLRTLKLFRCVHIVQLFEPVGGFGAIKPTFPSLIRLELEFLPEMEIICDESITFPSLEEIRIVGCPKLKKLPFQSRGKLKTIKIESECWERLEWEDNDLKRDFEGCFAREPRWWLTSRWTQEGRQLWWRCGGHVTDS